jgi:hypothetical protein
MSEGESLPPDRAWTGTPVRPHPGARDNGAESLPWGGRRDRLPLHWPFAAAVAGYRDKALANPSYDPASTFVWGQMMAVGLIEVLSAVEAQFGAAGHDAARAALRRVGARIVGEMIEGVALPPELSPVEAASLFASWINEVVYASIEKPRVHGDRADFDIHYCPHEDVYGAFDCRVQRYLVEGMIEAGREFFGSGALDVAFATTIPSGASTCHFDIVPRAAGESEAWSAYSDELRERALRLVPLVEPPDGA